MKHLQGGVAKGALTQEQAEAKYNAWVAAKEAKVNGKIGKLSTDAAAAKKAALEEENKVNVARAEAIAKRKAEEAAAKAAAEAEAKAAAEAEAAAKAAAEAAEAAEAPAEEAAPAEA